MNFWIYLLIDWIVFLRLSAIFQPDNDSDCWLKLLLKVLKFPWRPSRAYSSRAKLVVILDTGHHLAFKSTDLKILNNARNVKSVKVFKFCCKIHIPS